MKKKCLYFPLIALSLMACSAKDIIETEDGTEPPVVTYDYPLDKADSLTVISVLSHFQHPVMKFDPTDRSTWHCVELGLPYGSKHYVVTGLNLSASIVGEGTIAPEIGQFFYLKALKIEGEEIRGKLPEEIAKNLWLQSLTVNNTSLEGDIPEKYFSIPSLAMMEMRNNKNMTGALPRSLSKATKMTIDLSNNYFTGTIPVAEGVHCSVNVSNNRLTEIPEGYFTTGNTGGSICATGNRIGGTISDKVRTNPVYMLRLIQATASQQEGFGYTNFPTEYNKFDPEYLRGHVYPVSKRYQEMVNSLTKQDSLSLQEFRKFYSKAKTPKG